MSCLVFFGIEFCLALCISFSVFGFAKRVGGAGDIAEVGGAEDTAEVEHAHWFCISVQDWIIISIIHKILIYHQYIMYNCLLAKVLLANCITV